MLRMNCLYGQALWSGDSHLAQYSTYSPHPLRGCTAESFPPSAPPGSILCSCSASTPLKFFALLTLLMLLLTLLHSSSCSLCSVLPLLRMPHSRYSHSSSLQLYCRACHPLHQNLRG